MLSALPPLSIVYNSKSGKGARKSEQNLTIKSFSSEYKTSNDKSKQKQMFDSEW